MDYQFFWMNYRSLFDNYRKHRRVEAARTADGGLNFGGSSRND